MPTSHSLVLFAALLLPACARTTASTPTRSPATQHVAVAADGPRADTSETPSKTPPKSALRTTSGLASVVLLAGSGTESPGRGATIRAHYVGWTASDLAMFDNSYDRGEPVEIQAEHVIKGWGEILGSMVVGERRRVWIPEALAYEGKPGMPEGMLIFDIELVDFEPAQ